MENDQSIEALWSLPRTAFTISPNSITINPGAAPGPVGAGLLVEMPGFTVNSPKVRGSPATWDINIVAMEERNTNFLAGTGTLITSEQYAELCVDIFQLAYIFPYGTLTVKQNAISPAHDWMQIRPGIVAYRTSFEATVGRKQSTPTLAAQPMIAGGMCTINVPDGLSVAYYTTDGSMPVSSNSNPNNPAGVGATIYTAPFAVTSGTTVLCAARNPNPGYILSSINGALAP